MTTALDTTEIQERAYALWQGRGSSKGGAEQDWHDAEQQVQSERDAAAASLEPLAAHAAEALEKGTGMQGGKTVARKS